MDGGAITVAVSIVVHPAPFVTCTKYMPAQRFESVLPGSFRSVPPALNQATLHVGTLQLNVAVTTPSHWVGQVRLKSVVDTASPPRSFTGTGTVTMQPWASVTCTAYNPAHSPVIVLSAPTEPPFCVQEMT